MLHARGVVTPAHPSLGRRRRYAQQKVDLRKEGVDVTRRLVLLAILLIFGAGPALAQDGAAIYKKRCARCHDAPAGRIPPLTALRTMSPAAIVQALHGVMKAQAAGLTTNERYALVLYLASPFTTKATQAMPPGAFCSLQAQAVWNRSGAPSWNGWGGNLTNDRFQDTAAAGLTARDVPRLKLKWAFGLGAVTEARSQPSAAAGRVFVGSETGDVYSLDARTGCIYWIFKAEAGVRTAIVVGATAQAPGSAAAYFADEKANAYAVDAAHGKLLWKVHLEHHFAALVTGSPVSHAGVVYIPVSSFEEGLAGSPTYPCCTFRGSVVALDAVSGRRLWKTYTVRQPAHPIQRSKTGAEMWGPSGAAIWSTPTFDVKRNVLYVATGDNYSDPPTNTSDAVLALDAKTGKILWARQVTAHDVWNMGSGAQGSDFDFGQPPILITLSNGRRVLVIGQKSGVAYGLDPDQAGKVLWQTRVGNGGKLGGMQWGSSADHANVYVALSGLQVKTVPDRAAPQGFRLGIDPNHGGGLFALRLATGEKVWSAKASSCGERKRCSPAQSAALTAIPGAVFSGSVDGHLRAYSTSSGKVIWDVDTARKYTTVNGQEAQGGSLDGSGPAIADGTLYTTSGYGLWGGMPGNVLLAFSVDGK
jgi:polyvinyl alcohol dehydrogenase (cytochrome)